MKVAPDCYISPDLPLEERITLVEEILGFETPDVKGYQIAVSIFLRPNETEPLRDETGSLILDSQGNAKKIIIPELATRNDRWHSFTGLVIAMGPEAYKGKRYEISGAWTYIGEWVVFPRNEGTQLTYKDTPIQIFPDDRILMSTKNPEYITRI